MKNHLLKVRHAFRYLPMCLTVGNSLCGFCAILLCLEVYALYSRNMLAEIPGLLDICAWLILFAMLFDMLDGWTARKLNATSPYGIQMDSLADMVTFGVAPAVMVAVMAHTHTIKLDYVWVCVATSVYVVCVAMRLALYNVKAHAGTSTEAFSGLPSPGAAAAVCSLVLLGADAVPEVPALKTVTELLPLYVGVLGLLMVSDIPFPHIGHWLGDRKKYKLKIFLLIVFCLAFSWRSRLITAIAVNAYVFSGPIRYALTPMLRKRPATAATVQNMKEL